MSDTPWDGLPYWYGPEEARAAVERERMTKWGRLVEENERLKVQLAGCSVIALGGEMPAKDAYGWSVALEDIQRVRDENAELRAEVTAQQTEIARLQEKMADIEESTRIVLEEKCAPDEKHCTCVPILRRVAEAAYAVWNDSCTHTVHEGQKTRPVRCELLDELEAALGHYEDRVVAEVIKGDS